MDALNKLYGTLKTRNRPEDVAELVLDILKNDLNKSERTLLDKAARGSLRQQIFSYTSMAQEFSKAVGAERQIKKAIELFKLDTSVNLDPNRIADIEGFISQTSRLIHKGIGNNNFLSDRLNKTQRKEIGIDLSKRSYNKKWRLLKRLERKLLKYQRELKKIEFQMISKHGMAHHLDFEAFSKDLNTACFIAYYNARCNLRSVFTNQSQTRAYDEISDMLFRRCQGRPIVFERVFRKRKGRKIDGNTNWMAISYIYTSQDVLIHLTEAQKGALLGKWTNVLQEIAMLLDEVWNHSTIDRKTMIVKRGNDSTTWNNTAGAWNKARDQWMNIVYALGMDFILDDICFGKVMRLMAADVVVWHQSSGGSLDPNTQVWNQLPLPWEVFNDIRKCNKQLVLQCCKEAGIDAEKTGWIAPRTHGVEQFTPTPELVHGVEVSNPFLASVLKKHKYFSGKKAKPFYPENN